MSTFLELALMLTVWFVSIVTEHANHAKDHLKTEANLDEYDGWVFKLYSCCFMAWNMCSPLWHGVAMSVYIVTKPFRDSDSAMTCAPTWTNHRVSHFETIVFLMISITKLIKSINTWWSTHIQRLLLCSLQTTLQNSIDNNIDNIKDLIQDLPL